MRSPLLRGWLLLFLLAWALRLLVAWGDYGFVATDDHDHILRDAVPAQRSAGVPAVIEASGVRSPLPRLFVLGLSRIGLALGLAEPVDQVRWIYVVLGTVSMISVWGVYAMHRELGREDWALQGLVWSGCHFLAVFVSTRALLETMAAPFLTLSGVLLVFYSRRLRFRWLLGALVALTLASLFRFQAGICVPVLVAAPIVLRRRRDLIPLAAAGAFLFACTGWLDFLLRDSFHASLRAYLSHNIDAGTDYGVSAWYNYILLLLGASLPPLLFSRFRNFPWRDYRELWPVIAMTSLFVLAHSAVPHKEDRFMVPIFPLYLALLAPLAAHLFARRPKSWRSFAFVLINATLIALLVGTPSQNNAIAMVRFLGERPSIRYLWALAGSLKVYPVAYSEREPAKLHRLSLLPLRAAQTLGCETAIVVPETRSALIDRGLDGFEEVAVFYPGILEKLLIVTNPSRNARRGPLHLYLREGCPAS